MFRFGDPGGRIYQTLGTSNANVLAYWTSLITASSGSSLSIVAGGGRTVGSCYRWSVFNTSNPTASYFSKTLDSQATWGVAFAVRTSSLPNVGAAVILVSFVDAGTSQVDVRLNNAGQIFVTRGGTTLGTSAFVVPTNVWCHIEFKVTINPSTGTVFLGVNGVTQLNLTGQNTRSSANSSANQIQVGMNNTVQTTLSSTVNIDFDDIIIYDGQTTDALGNADITGPIGDCRLAVIPPSGAGAVTQFTALGTSPNYNCLIDALGPDGDSTCVQSGTVGQTDTYVTGGLPSSATVVKAVALVEYARKTDAGARTLSPVIRSGGGNSVHPTANALGTNYQYFFNNWGQNPNNGSPTAWTQSGVNAIEIGQQVSG